MACVWGGGVITVLILVVVIGYVLVQGIPGLSLDFLLTPLKAVWQEEVASQLSSLALSTLWG